MNTTRPTHSSIPTLASIRSFPGLAVCLILLGVGLKVALLATSQSMADGDEAVEGIMAMHVTAPSPGDRASGRVRRGT